MRTPLRLAATLVAVCVLAVGCSNIKVQSDYDPAIDFSRYGAYAWIPEPAAADGEDPRIAGDDLLRQRIERAVDAGLSAKGMRRVDAAGDASLLVTEHVSVEQKLRVNTTHYGYGYGGWGYYGYGGPAYSDTRVDQYEQGTLILDFIDPGTKSLVWRGMAKKRLREAQTPEEREREVQRVVAAILEKYPPSR